MNKKTIRDIDVHARTVLVRVDYNVPIESGRVRDDLRIRASVESLRYLIERDCRIVVMSHLGKPGGVPDARFSLRPVATVLSALLEREVAFAGDCIGQGVSATVAALRPGAVLLLENLRFHDGESANDPAFARALAQLGQLFVNDAFAVEHRKHASVVGIPSHLPAVAGFLVEREVDTLTRALEAPRRPLLAVIGGAKVSTKIDVVRSLLAKVDVLIVGGAMANTLLAAQGYPIGKSRYEPDQLGTAKDILGQAAEGGVKLLLPSDVMVAPEVAPGAVARPVAIAGVSAEDVIVDVGPGTIEAASAHIAAAGTIVWNGPVGISEIPAFATASRRLAELILGSGAASVVAGGDTAGFIDEAGWHDRFGLVSTGGGATLELIAGKPLPGIEALLDRPQSPGC